MTIIELKIDVPVHGYRYTTTKLYRWWRGETTQPPTPEPTYAETVYQVVVIKGCSTINESQAFNVNNKNWTSTDSDGLIRTSQIVTETKTNSKYQHLDNLADSSNIFTVRTQDLYDERWGGRSRRDQITWQAEVCICDWNSCNTDSEPWKGWFYAIIESLSIVVGTYIFEACLGVPLIIAGYCIFSYIYKTLKA